MRLVRVAPVQSDFELDEFIRPMHQCLSSMWHLQDGTDEQSVVDPNGLVYGLDGLRIADASIFPQIVNCNAVSHSRLGSVLSRQQLSCLAEKISDEIKKKYA